MIAIFGGGFSGLTLAWELVKRGHEVTVYEKANRLGGLIETVEVDGLKHERAANAFLSTPEIRNLFNELEIEMELPKPAAKIKYFYRGGVKRWPLSFFETLGMLKNFLLNVFNLQPKDHESVKSWAERCLGISGTKYLLAPALTGIYAGDISKMSAKLVIGSFLKKKSKSLGSIRPAGGMSEFFKKIEIKLRSKNCKIVLNSAQEFQKLQGIRVLAFGAEQVEEVLKVKLPMQSVAKVTLKFPKPLPLLPGFGILIPEEFSSKVLGVLFDSNVFKEEVYAETWILGGARWPDVSRNADAELIEIILTERRRLFGAVDVPTKSAVTIWQKGIPEYDFDLETHIDANFFSKLEKEKVYFHGNFLGDIGLSRIYERSVILATKI